MLGVFCVWDCRASTNNHFASVGPFETQLGDACWVSRLPNTNTFGIINIDFVVVVVFIESIKNGK